MTKLFSVPIVNGDGSYWAYYRATSERIRIRVYASGSWGKCEVQVWSPNGWQHAVELGMGDEYNGQSRTAFMQVIESRGVELAIMFLDGV